MSFQADFQKWMETELINRKGACRRRLEQGLGHAERHFVEYIWYPAFHDLYRLHPEFGVADYRDGIRYLDFAYLNDGLRLAIEIDGYRAHSAEISRLQFSDSLMRQNHLVLDGWKVLRFSFDDMKERPRMCQQLLQQFMGKSLLGRRSESSAEIFLQLEVLRHASRLEHHLRPSDVMELLKIKKRDALKLLQSMTAKQQLLLAGKGTTRIRCYKINPEKQGANFTSL